MDHEHEQQRSPLSAQAADLAPPQPVDAPAPVAERDRISAIDTLRGFALLGILTMNIPFFALSEHAWIDPSIHGWEGRRDELAWLVSHFIFDMKMMSIFSMLFGAGFALMAQRAAERSASIARIYYRRIFWLLVIGLVHAYLIWYGDILVLYAVCGAALFLFRRRRPATLIALGLALVLIAIPINVGMAFMFDYLKDEAGKAQAILDSAQVPTEAQLEAVEAWHETRSDFVVGPGDIEEEQAMYLEYGPEAFAARAKSSFWMQTMGLFVWGLWRAGGLMLIGMGLLRLGVLTGARSPRFYAAMAALGYAVGFPIIAVGVQQTAAHERDFIYMFRLGIQFNYVGSLFVAAGHIGLIMLICRLGALRAVTAALAAVGRMALTNYLAQSIICTTIFYGFGFAQWGKWTRFELWAVVLAVWAAQLIWSPIWLRHYRFGPAEWLWRSLTYGAPQPMRRA